MKLTIPALMLCLTINLGCAAEKDNAKAQSNTVNVTCHLAYRATPQGQFVEKNITVKVPLQSGPVAEIARTQIKNHAFDDMKVQIRYDVNSFMVQVSDAKTDKQIWSQLYQLQPGLRNQFIGSHGFTGLAYVNHPTSDAQLQTWSVVGDK